MEQNQRFGDVYINVKDVEVFAKLMEHYIPHDSELESEKREIIDAFYEAVGLGLNRLTHAPVRFERVRQGLGVVLQRVAR